MASQLAAAQDKTADKREPLKGRDKELQAARDEQRKAIETEASLKREIEQFGADRRKLNQDLIDTAARLRGLESQIAATVAKLVEEDFMTHDTRIAHPLF